MKLTEKEDYELQREEEGKMTSKAYETGIRKKKLYKETGTAEEGLKLKARVTEGHAWCPGKADSTEDLGWELDLVEKGKGAGGEVEKQV